MSSIIKPPQEPIVLYRVNHTRTPILMAKLNPQQQAAVKVIDNPLLVLAGAGSGKTRVITEKIAYLVKQGLPARHIAAVTFTNKAAREMKSRVSKLLDDTQIRGLRVSTFHSLGLDILRKEHKVLTYKAAITLFDEQDKLALISIRSIIMPIKSGNGKTPLSRPNKH